MEPAASDLANRDSYLNSLFCMGYPELPELGRVVSPDDSPVAFESVPADQFDKNLTNISD